MKSLFSNILKLSAISVFMVCGLSACSDDSSNSSNATPSSSNSVPTSVDVIPTPTGPSPISINKMSVSPNGEKSVFVISGGAGLDLLDTSTIPAGAEVFFTKIKLSINKIENGVEVGTPLTITCQGQPCSLTKPIQIVNLTELGARIEDYNRSDCGTFRITASYFASYDADNLEKYIDNDSYDFVREQSYCEDPQQQDTTATNPQSTIVLTSYEVVVNTKKGDGLSLATGTAVPAAQADLVFSSDDLTGEIKLATANGAKIAPYSNDGDSNYDDDWNATDLPPAPVTMSNFRFSSRNLSTSVPFFDSFIFYVVTTANYNAETGDGFYAVAAKDVPATPDENKNFAITLIVYKK